MGLVPDHWGPYVWASIHLICIGAPEVLDASQQLHYKVFFNTLPYVIPCEKCSTHLKENLQKLPVDDRLTGRADLFKWSVDLHNVVNEMLGKPVMSYKDAEAKWKAICTPKDSKPYDVQTHKNDLWKYALAFFLGIVLTMIWSSSSSSKSTTYRKRG